MPCDHILDTLPEAQFDRLVELAVHVFNLSMALVSFVDEERPWLKANQGVPFAETSGCESFCAVAIEQNTWRTARPELRRRASHRT